MSGTGVLHQGPPMQWAMRLKPPAWRICRLKDIADINRAALPETTDPDFSFTYVDIGSVDADGCVRSGEEITFGVAPSRARRLVQSGDSIVSTVRTYLKAIAHIDEASAACVVSTGFATVTPRPGVHPRFLYWWLRGSAFVEEIVARSVGVSYPAVNSSDVGDVTVLVPSGDEQLRIIDVLDTETARIDALCAELIHAARLLEERSSAAQIHLVSGRTATSSLRASGVEWLGDVPSHWSIVPLKSVARMESGHTPSRSRPELWEDCSIPWISLHDVGSMGREEFISSTTNLISEAGIAESSARLLPAGTVVLSRDATIGRAAIMAAPMATSQHFGAWVCGEQLRPRYLWLLFSTVMQSHFDTLTEGSTIRTIGMPELRSFKVPLPALVEQDAIVEAACRLRGTAMRLRSEMERQLAYLREHRQALITAAVTGGLDAVRKVA